MSQLALLEHPATLELLTEGWLSSMWRLWVTKVGAVQLTKVYQGYYNGLSPKPTNLLISIGPDINAQEFLDARRARDTLPPALSMTKGEEHYTAALKNYPKDFCTALVALAAEWNSRYVHMFYWRIQKRRGVQ